MKKFRKVPKLLPTVMEAIADLKEKRGSGQNQIIEQLTHILKKNGKTSRNVTMQVKRALDHGTLSGLIKQKRGKYSLGLDKKDYAVFKRFEKSKPSDVKEAKRGRKKRRRKGRRRRSRPGRRRRVSAEDKEITDESHESLPSLNDDSEQVDRARRKTRRRKGRRRRRRGRKHAPNNSSAGQDSPSVNQDTIQRDEHQADNYSKSATSHNHSTNGPDQERHQYDDNKIFKCGNPNCICHIKQEHGTPRCMSREDYYEDPYLN